MLLIHTEEEEMEKLSLRIIIGGKALNPGNPMEAGIWEEGSEARLRAGPRKPRWALQGAVPCGCPASEPVTPLTAKTQGTKQTVNLEPASQNSKVRGSW